METTRKPSPRRTIDNDQRKYAVLETSATDERHLRLVGIFDTEELADNAVIECLVAANSIDYVYKVTDPLER